MIIDTNVIVLAEHPFSSVDDRLDDECIEACQELILDIINNVREINLDADGEIIAEYLRQVGYAGQPGLGRQFVRWLFDHQHHIESIHLHEILEHHTNQINKINLDNPDPSDMKFLYLAACCKATIYQATDCKWHLWVEDLKPLGININFLCYQYTQQRLKDKQLA